MRTIPLLHPLDDTGRLPRPACTATATAPDLECDRVQEAAAELVAALATPVPEPTVADLTRYHHPHFISAEPERYGARFVFRLFTGLEEEPYTPSEVWGDETLTREQRRELDLQYDAARVMWSKARLRRKVAPVLRRAAPVWQAWTAAETVLTETFDGFRTTADTMWRARLLALTDAEEIALAAAGAWDEIAEDLAQLAHEQIRSAGEEYDLPLETIATEIGLDASDWHISYAGDYQRGTHAHWDWKTPLVRTLTTRIEWQRERLAEIDRLAAGTTKQSA